MCCLGLKELNDWLVLTFSFFLQKILQHLSRWYSAGSQKCAAISKDRQNARSMTVFSRRVSYSIVPGWSDYCLLFGANALQPFGWGLDSKRVIQVKKAVGFRDNLILEIGA